jgi:hypothetical protein
MILRLRYGPQLMTGLYLATVIYFNYIVIYALVSGKMKIRGRFQWIEGRESLPSGYWIFVLGYGGVALALDVASIWFVYSALKKPIQPPVPTRGNGT